MDGIETTMTIVLPGVDRDDPRLDNLAQAAMDAVPGAVVTATTEPAKERA